MERGILYKSGLSFWRASYDRELPPKLLLLCIPDECKVCDKTFNAYPQANDHYLSKKHGKNVDVYLTNLFGNTNEKNIPKQIHRNPQKEFKHRESECRICKKSFNSSDVRDAHMKGKIHLKNLERIRNKASDSIISVSFDSSQDDKSQDKMTCKLCQMQFTSLKSKEQHIHGKRHKLKAMGNTKQKEEK